MRADLAERYGLDSLDTNTEDPMPFSRPKHCGIAAHEALKADLATFRAATTLDGFQEQDGAEPLELRSCKRCGGQLAAPVQR